MVPNLLGPHNLKPKIVNGKTVTCRKMIQYFKEYAASFDGETLPQPQSILNANAKLICIEAAHEAKVNYCRGMDRSTYGTRMMSEKKLLEAHIKHGITALNIYDKCPEIGSNEVRRLLLEKLQEDINAELERCKRLNKAKRVTGCASAMLACGDSVFLGIGLGSAASGAIAVSIDYQHFFNLIFQTESVPYMSYFQVIIISVAGAFRKGKSFLLNFFLEYLYNLHKSQQSDSSLEWLTDDCQLHGFHWRAGVKRDTQLVFCVRDFKNQEEYEFGENGGIDFLDNVLQTNSEQPEEIKAVRELLREYFEDIQCYLLPHPGYKVAERRSFRGHVKDLRPLFREELKKMVPNLLGPHNLKPKIVNGKTVTCRKMIQYFKEYAASFDGETLPQPQSILNANAKLICIEAAHEAKVNYCRGMDRSTYGTRMMSEKKLLEAHIKHGITALNIYDKCPKIGSNEVRRLLLEKLQENINAELERYKRLNVAKRVTGCASAMLACGDSVFLGIGFGSATSGAIAGAVLTLQAGVVSLGIVAIPISLTTLFFIWAYVWTKLFFEKITNKNK